MNCKACNKKLNVILMVNIPLYTCANERCNKYGILVCDPYSEVDECIKQIYEEENE